MKNTFLIALCILGAVGDFILWTFLRKYKVKEKAPMKFRALSREERKQRIRNASWIMFGSGWFFLAGAVFLYWLGNLR